MSFVESITENLLSCEILFVYLWLFIFFQEGASRLLLPKADLKSASFILRAYYSFLAAINERINLRVINYASEKQPLVQENKRSKD